MAPPTPRSWLPCALLVALCLQPPAFAAGDARPGAGPITSVEDLLARFAAMPGLSARFQEEKQIALLARPLRSRGRLAFVPPGLLVRRVDEPAPSVLELSGDRLHYADAGGSEELDLNASPEARVFAGAFTDVLAGDLARLRQGWEISFAPAPAAGETGWQLGLVPRSPVLARAIERITLRGRGLALAVLEVRETSGDVTTTRFADVDPAQRLEDAQIAELRRPPLP